MKKGVILGLGCWCVVLGADFLLAAEQVPAPVAAQPQNPAQNPVPSSMTKQTVRDQVKDLRQARLEKMPYLNRGYIQETINESSVRNKIQFSGNEKKTLKEIIERAIQVHTRARAARERISLSKRKMLTALRELFPQIGVEFSDKDGVLSPSLPYLHRDYHWTFRQPVFRGGALWNALLKEKATLEANEREFDQVISDLINDVSAAYFEMNRTLSVVADQQAALEKVKRFVDISKEKWKQELISEIENLNAQSLASQMEYDHESGKQEMELAKVDLQRFLDLSFDDPMEVAGIYNVPDLIKTENLPPDDSNMKGAPGPEKKESGIKEGSEVPNIEILVDLAYQNRPELRVESAKLQAARLEERIKWGEMMPKVDVTMEFGRLGEQYKEDSKHPKMNQEFRLLMEFNWNAGGNKISYNFENNEQAPSLTQYQAQTGTNTTSNTVKAGILDGLKEIADIKQAEVDKLDQIVELEKAEKEVIHDVKEAYFDYQRSAIQVQSSIKRVEYRDRLVKLALHRLENNEIQISEYLQAEIDLLRERTELHKALKEFFTAKAKMNRAVGVRDFLTVEDSYGK